MESIIIQDTYLTNCDCMSKELVINLPINQKYIFNVIDLKRFIFLQRITWDCGVRDESVKISKILNVSVLLEYFDFTMCNLIDIDNLQNCHLLKYIDVSMNIIKSLEKIPMFVETLIVNNNLITSLDNLPPNIKLLNCSYNKILKLDNLPENLEILDCCNNLITLLDNLPPRLKKLSCSYNSITNLKNLPTGIIYLDCGFNSIGNLDWLPSGIEILCSNGNFIKTYENIPKIKMVFK